MSSTGRGGDRSLLDDYPTPTWAVDRLLDRVPLPRGKYLELSAGAGGVVDAVRRHPSAGPRVESFTGVELNEAAHGETLRRGVDVALFGDFLKLAPTLGRFDVSVGNPPYEPALRFIQAALPIVEVLALLLRHNFLGSIARWRFWRQNMASTYVLPQRPTFVVRARRDAGGKIHVTSNDSCDYAWFVWRRSELPRAEGRTAVLDLTPPEVVEAAKEEAPVLFEEADGSIRRITQAELRELLASASAARRSARLTSPGRGRKGLAA